MKDVITLEDYHWRAENVYTPIFPVIAQQIIDRFGITEGICLDAGCCGGYLGIAMARLTNLAVILMDIEEEALKIADSKILENNPGNRIRTLLGDVHKIPLESESINIVISRASVQFWDNWTKAFSEIYRVLAPGGAAYVGGGYGTPELRARVGNIMKKYDPGWGGKHNGDNPQEREARFRTAMEEAGIARYEIISDSSGSWLALSKPASHS